MDRSHLRRAGRVGLILLVAAAAVAAGFLGTRLVRQHTGRTAAQPTVPAVPSVYARLGAAPVPATRPAAPVPVPAAVSRALAGPASAEGLGTRVRAEVLDVASGAVLYNRAGTVPAAPASTAKLLTAAALLAVRPATGRIVTRLVAGPRGAVVLVGGGDPTLTGAPARRAGAYPDAARISDLAAQLTRAHVRPTRILVDDSLFAGPAVSPAWAPEDVPSDYASAVTPVMADGGRATPDDGIRSSTPDLAAGAELAAALHRPNLSVQHGRAGAGARVLATVSSAPYATLVEQMLQQSDNVIAECLARQVAIAEHDPVTFTGAATAIRSVLTRLGVDPGTGMVDGSGLAARDRLSTRTLADLLRTVAGPAHPQLRVLLAGLPVAAWSGTLASRYLSGTSRIGAGAVRAKTGTLSGVSSLAGLVHDRAGRLLAFALIADRASSTAAADAALDDIATALVRCGCR